ncbi:MAG: PEGA domain-containing protein [Fibromonadales bacterium]|nr:PEGA domain-containing protein [Fibromonadales bacterium]
MNKIPLMLLLLFAFAVQGQQQKRIAIINTVDDGEPQIATSDLTHLTDRLREIATDNLSQRNYAVMTQQSIVAFLGSQEEAARKCRESSCLAQLGREVNADYVAQGRTGRFGVDLAIKVELYESGKGTLVGSFTGTAKDIYGLLSVIDEKAPAMFAKMPKASGGKAGQPSIQGGISGVQSGGGKNLYVERYYLANITTEPPGAALSFNGMPSCPRTPCGVQLPEGRVRIVSVLDQYETTDTTISITRNNQSINIDLKPSFGILEIKPAYIDGMGRGEQWSLTINGKAYSSYENRLAPGRYKIDLSHECYEDIAFNVGLNKGSHESFNIAQYIIPKQGALVLSAERNDEPVSEPVYINGKHADETPFSGTVPLCAKIEIGSDLEAVNVNLQHNARVSYTHRIKSFMRIGISIEHREWAEKLLAKLNRFERYDVSIISKRFFDPGDYDYIISGTNYKNEWVNPKDGKGYYSQSMDVVILKDNKTLTSYRTNCPNENSNSCDASEDILQTFSKLARLKASVIDVNKGDITINRGANSDVKKGDVYLVFDKEGKKTIGKIRIKEAGEQTSVAKKIRGKVSKGSNLQESDPFNPANFYLVLQTSGVTSTSGDYDRERYRTRYNVLLGGEGYDLNSLWGVGLFIGGGTLEGDIGEFILGGDFRKLIWILEERIALPFSLGLAWRMQWAYIKNKVVANFISDFEKEPDDYLDKSRTMTKHNFDIMPGIDLQIFITDGFSIYAGYMYRLAVPGDWSVSYKIPDKYYKDNESGDDFKVPDEYNPMRDPVERFPSVKMPGVLRFGIKVHPF